MRYKIAFIISVVTFIISFAWAIWSFSHPDWEKWQKEFYQTQIKVLSQRLTQTEDMTQRKNLQDEITKLKVQQPEVITLNLPNGKIERCRTCHLGIEEISPSHPIETFGCTICHGGNPLSLDAGIAHQGMYGGGHPGRLEVAQLSCGTGNGPASGQCHSGHPRAEDNLVDLVGTSLMASKGGELSMTRYMYGLDIPSRVLVQNGETAAQISDPFNNRPEQNAFKQNCLESCHQRGGGLPGQGPGIVANGCESCHVLTNWAHTYQGQDVTIPKDKAGYGLTHRLTTQIPYTQCNQCHNQGKYDLYTFHFTPRPDLERFKSSPPPAKESLGQRWQNVYQPRLVFTKCEVNLDCIDCHTRQEVMGDGHLYSSEYQTLKIQCRDCHGTIAAPPSRWQVKSADDPAFQSIRVNPASPRLNIGDEILVTGKGEELPFVRYENTKWFVYSKVTGKKTEIPLAYGSACRQKPDKQTSNDCHQCHDVSGNLGHGK